MISGGKKVRIKGIELEKKTKMENKRKNRIQRMSKCKKIEMINRDEMRSK